MSLNARFAFFASLQRVTIIARDQDANDFVEFVCGEKQQATLKA
jgi:hypothetical protein